MKTSTVSLVAILLAAAPVLAGDRAIPDPWPADRYAAMAQASPFALATPAAPVAAQQASFAANWFVGGLGRLGDVDYVTIKSRDLTSQFSLYGHEPAKDGTVLAEVKWSDELGKSTVTLRKGNETALLEFNEADLRGPAPAAAPGADGKRPAGAPNMPVGAVAPGGLPSMTPMPMARPAPGTMPPSQMTQPDNTRRRIRPISVPR